MKKQTRFAHSEGITDIAIREDGKILTTGGDERVRIFNEYSDDAPASFHVRAPCFGIKVTDKDHVIVCTEANSVEYYTYPRGKFVDTKLKFSNAVNHVDVSKDGKVVVAGSADMTIQVIGQSGGRAKNIDAHRGPVLAVSIDPLVKLFASSGCDGSVNVWSLKKLNQPVKKWDNVFPSSTHIESSSTLCRMAWHPSGGNYLAVPSRDKIILYSRDKWTAEQSLTCSKLTKMFSVVQFSPCGLYICGGGTDGTIVIWDTTVFTVKMQIKESQHITGMAFNSKNHELLCTDISGRLISVREFLTTDASSSGTKSTDEKSVRRRIRPANEERKEAAVLMGDTDTDYAMLVGGNDAKEDASSLATVKANVGFVGEEYAEPSKLKKAVDKADIVDKENRKGVSSVGSSKVFIPEAAPTAACNVFTAPQNPFQPGSPPEHLTHRFMVWNNVGVIRSYSAEDDEISDNAIDIEFHDAKFHHAIHLRNQQDYTVGNVSNEAVALACGRTANNPAKLFCLSFSSCDSSKEWTVNMPADEEVTGIALGTGWIAASTSENRIHIFSIGGIQKFIYDFCGTIVAVAGFEDQLFITYHNGVGTNGNQSILFSVLKLNSTSTNLLPLMVDAPLPLSKQATLSWIGFTDEGTPTYLDSKHVLRLLNGHLWSPYCDLTANLRSANDYYWVIGVSEIAAHVRAVKCKGTKYPMALSRPTAVVISAKIPLCEMDTEKSQMEDTMLQALITDAAIKKLERKCGNVEKYKDKSEVTLKEALFKLFLLATKSNRDLLASEYVAMMPTASSMQNAVKVARKLPNGLANRLQAICRAKIEQEKLYPEKVDERINANMKHGTVSNNDSDRRHADILNAPQGNNIDQRVPDISTRGNPSKKEDPLHSLMISGTLVKNPSKKDASSSSTNLSRKTRFHGSLTTINSDTDTLNSSHLVEHNQLATAKIDVQRKLVYETGSMPEEYPKIQKRKSPTSNSNDEQPVRKRAHPFEKKEKDEENGAKSQIKLNDMARIKSKRTKSSSSKPKQSKPIVEAETNRNFNIDFNFKVASSFPQRCN